MRVPALSKKPLAALAALLLLSLGAAGCAPRASLPTVPAIDVAESDDAFTLIYFVGTDREDMRRAVILDLEGDGYTIQPEIDDLEYEILVNVSMGEAVYEAGVFFSQEPYIARFTRSAILAPDGESVIGYELRPLYDPVFYNTDDILDIAYSLNVKRRIISLHVDIKRGLSKAFMYR